VIRGADDFEPSTIPRLAYTADELAVAVGISLGSLNGWIRAGDHPPFFVAPGGRTRIFPLDTAREWLRAKVEGGDDDHDA
jgi:hypothetical protein